MARHELGNVQLMKLGGNSGYYQFKVT